MYSAQAAGPRRGCLERKDAFLAGWLEMDGLSEVVVVDLESLPQGLESKYQKFLKGENLNEADVKEVLKIQNSLRARFDELGEQHFHLGHLKVFLQEGDVSAPMVWKKFHNRGAKFGKVLLRLMQEQDHLSSKLKKVESLIEEVESKWMGEVNIGLLCCRHLLGELPARSVPQVLVPGS